MTTRAPAVLKKLDNSNRTHQPRRIGTKEIKVGNIQAAQIIANADLGHNNTELNFLLILQTLSKAQWSRDYSAKISAK